MTILISTTLPTVTQIPLIPQTNSSTYKRTQYLLKNVIKKLILNPLSFEKCYEKVNTLLFILTIYIKSII